MAVLHTVRLGVTNTYLIRGADGWLLVDTGIRGKEALFFRQLARRGILPEQIRLIVITHGHFDHVGTLFAIKSRCRCPVLIHAADAHLVRNAEIAIPPGISRIGRWVSRLGRQHPRMVQRLYRFPAVEPDIVIRSETPLENRGFPACVIPTPGHTKGSVSLLTGSGEAFVGDLAFNMLPAGRRLPLPPFAENRARLIESWRRLLKKGAVRMWPAHGFPFLTERLSL